MSTVQYILLLITWKKKRKKEKRKNRLNGYVHNVPVDYDDIDISGITDIYKKHNIVIYV